MKTADREYLTRWTVLLLPPSMAEKLEQQAIREGISLAEAVRRAVAASFEEKR